MLKTLIASAVLSQMVFASNLEQELLNKMRFDDVQANGSGCKKGEASVIVSPDKQVFTVVYDDFRVGVGPEAKEEGLKKRAVCTISATVKVPPGYQWAIANTRYTGYLDLQPGALVRQKSVYWFQGANFEDRVTMGQYIWMGQDTEIDEEGLFVSGFDGYFEYTDAMEVESNNYSPCGAERYLNIKMELNMRESRQHKLQKLSSTAGIDDTETSLEEQYGYRFGIVARKCQ